jgi:putative transcriptional regulator
MTLKNIDFNRKALTIAGVKFPDADALDSAASALGSQMYEGFVPTRQLIEVYRDYKLGKFPPKQLMAKIRNAIQ